jgi:hypothetical protein
MLGDHVDGFYHAPDSAHQGSQNGKQGKAFDTSSFAKYGMLGLDDSILLCGMCICIKRCEFS